MPSGNVQDQHILQLIYVLHLVQILLTTDQFSSKKKKKEEEDGICDQDVGRENTGTQFKRCKLIQVIFLSNFGKF